MVSLESQTQGKHKWNKIDILELSGLCDRKDNPWRSSVVTPDGSRAVLKYPLRSGEDSSTFIVEPEKGHCGVKCNSQNHYATDTSLEDTSCFTKSFSELTCSAFRAQLLCVPCRTSFHWLGYTGLSLHIHPIRDPYTMAASARAFLKGPEQADVFRAFLLTFSQIQFWDVRESLCMGHQHIKSGLTVLYQKAHVLWTSRHCFHPQMSTKQPTKVSSSAVPFLTVNLL